MKMTEMADKLKLIPLTVNEDVDNHDIPVCLSIRVAERICAAGDKSIWVTRLTTSTSWLSPNCSIFRSLLLQKAPCLTKQQLTERASRASAFIHRPRAITRLRANYGNSASQNKGLRSEWHTLKQNFMCIPSYRPAPELK